MDLDSGTDYLKDLPDSFVPGIQRRSQQFACGKAIIVGEHAVVYGAKAVAMPVLSMGVTVEGRVSPDLDGVRLLLNEKDLGHQLSGVIHDACSLLKIPAEGIEFQGTSTLPIGAGLGSSASLCVVVLRTLSNLYSLDLSVGQIAQLANQMEKRFHGNPSGLDTAVVSSGAVIEFEKGGQPSPIALTNPVSGDNWKFVLIDSGCRSATREMIEIARPWFTDREQGSRRIDRFNELALKTTVGLKQGDFRSVAEAMSCTQHYLDEAGVAGKDIRRIIEVCDALGVHGAKLTGAGGGGCVLGLLDQDAGQNVLGRLQEKFGTTNVYLVEIN